MAQTTEGESNDEKQEYLFSLKDVKEASETLDLTVTTTSKVREGIYEAPGAITIVSANEIERFGAQNLTDVLDRVVGALPAGSYAYPNNTTSFRGDLPGHIDNHVLILMNGRPMRDSWSGGVNMNIYMAFPLSAIQRLEIIRGPGSVLYGTNAYTAVINIITWNNQNRGFELSAGAGSYGSRFFNFISRTSRDNWNITAAGQSQLVTGWPFRMLDETPNNPQLIQMDFGARMFGGVISATNKKASINTFISYVDQDNIGTIGVKTTDFTRKKVQSFRAFGDVGYRDYIKPWWEASANLNYNFLALDNVVNRNPNQNYSNDYLLETTHFFKVNRKLNLTVGGTAYYQNGRAFNTTDSTLAIPTYDRIWYSSYLQGDYRPFTKYRMRIIAGGQLNMVPNLRPDLVPRVGLILPVPLVNNLYFKALYGGAFRMPWALETDIQAPGVLLGNKQLGPEIVGTYDFQLFYSTPKIQTAFTYYTSSQSNLIARVPITGSTANTFTNLSTLGLSGLEFEFKYQINKQLLVMMNAAASRSLLNSSIENSTLVPNRNYGGGISYDFNGLASFSIYGNYWNAWQDNVILASGRQARNPESKPVVMITAKAGVNLMKVFKPKSEASLWLNVYGTNLLDEDVWYSEFVRRRVNTFQGRPPRQVFISISYKL